MDDNDRIKNIYATLDSMQNCWYISSIDDRSTELAKFCKRFFDHNQVHAKLPEQYSIINSSKKECEYDIPYNASPFHFFLYYAYPPSIPFAVFSDKAIVTGSFMGKRYDSLVLSLPWYQSLPDAIVTIDELLSQKTMARLFDKIEISKAVIRDVNDPIARYLIDHRSKKMDDNNYTLQALKEINYSIYNLSKTVGLAGLSFKNVRWHLNQFNRMGYKIDSVDVADAPKHIIHLIGQWRSHALSVRKFSYVNVSSDTFAVPIVMANQQFVKNIQKSDNSSTNEKPSAEIITRVLSINGKISSFNLGYTLALDGNSSVCAHAIGISDLSIPHLAEYAAHDFQNTVLDHGYTYLNDGSSWRKGLANFKNKFRPIDSKRYYWATIEISHGK